MANQVGLKLEAALRSYIVANFQEAGDPLEGVTIYHGRSSDTRGATSWLTIEAGEAGGDLANVGNYEVPMTFELVTSFEPQDSSETSAVLRARHGARVSALLGIFGESRTRAVPAALTVLDPELGCSFYKLESMSEERGETEARTKVVILFDGYLV